MGCSYSTTNDYEQLTDFSVTELLIAKRPGGREVGPITKFERSCDRFTRKAAQIEGGPVLNKKLPFGMIIFSVVKVVVNDDGVMFYHFIGSSAKDPTFQLHIAKRYTEFKTLHEEISKLMVSERMVAAAQQQLNDMQPVLPEMPKADVWTYLRGRFSNRILEEREEQFTRILNAIARHSVAFRSTSFTTFLLR
ncbi:unnamed protein product [Peronospora belbahrii]|uniref:PX domain-containing protein n=1 Tax=Peronospora belbahrii TaxID=622444 RepID=A0AAU9L8X2_9STRA|nr:unnamed protein product [Peronospora belbahrii]CAH0522373.1 unnamed protein product [Peronospora belbahrii]